MVFLRQKRFLFCAIYLATHLPECWDLLTKNEETSRFKYNARSISFLARFHNCLSNLNER
jgi:hypothetical protein